MFSIIIPLYNEEKNIEPLLNELSKNLDAYKNYEVILINDASTDSTLQKISNLNYKNIKIINNKFNRGQSFSIHAGIKISINNVIITLDGDGQNDPSDIPKLMSTFIDNNDVMLVGGIRIKRKDNIIKIFSSKIANFVRSLILNDGCKDTGCSLKIFYKNIFLQFPYFDGMHRFLPALFKGYGHKTLFVDVKHRKRKYGVSKYGTMKRLFKGIIDIIKVKKILKNKT